MKFFAAAIVALAAFSGANAQATDSVTTESDTAPASSPAAATVVTTATVAPSGSPSVAASSGAPVTTVPAGTAIAFITAPLMGVTWTAGKTYLVTWTQPKVTVFTQITLAHGNSNALQTISTIGTNVPTAPLQWNWTIPATLAPGTDYALSFGVAPNIAYAGPFTVLGADGTSPTAGAPASAGVSYGATATGGSSTNSAAAPAVTTLKNTSSASGIAIEIKTVVCTLAAIVVALVMF
ncbi:hypothetical protein BC936DRAFT_147943 [Jimgerdemannia flammicorona]|uniref:Yeast cell wall synthesis Kre9/Knh1-like N-terminal domain-containing protein n=1 Tax=Jimgerdemannia flammicorona TaxID=994334 RepID=A0A433D462_9FUNG|nr:hypothetical protein BC936DRAFT_147943 [Jimgerdemannia flammicorona]